MKTTLDAVWQYIKNILVGIDLLLNALIGGSPFETLSSHAWRSRDHKYWYWCYRAINALFFLQKDHCKEAYESRIAFAIWSIENGGKP